MGIKQQVRKRRNERKKIILHDTKPATNDDVPQSGMDFQVTSKDRFYDPEYMWKKGNDERWREWNEPANQGQWMIPIMVCCVLFLAIWGIFQLDHPYALKAQSGVTTVMTNDIDFQQFSDWYESVFSGSPSFLPAFDKQEDQTAPTTEVWKHDSYHYPVKGSITVPFEVLKTGIKLNTAAFTKVHAIDEGRVVYVGTLDTTRNTVMIQHKNQVRSIYGHLDDINHEVNDWVEGGEIIGITEGQSDQKSGSLFFSIKKDNTYVNPTEVILFD